MNNNSTHKELRNFTNKVSNSIKIALAFTAVLIAVGNIVIAQNANISPDKKSQTLSTQTVIGQKNIHSILR